MSALINTNIPFVPTASKSENKESEYLQFKASNVPKSRKGKRWDEFEDESLMSELKKGLSHDDIAKLHGRTTNAIALHIQELGLRMKEQKMDVEDIKKELNLKDEDIATAEKRAKSREDNLSVNLAESLGDLKKQITGLEAIILKQNSEIAELKNLVVMLVNKK